MPVGGQNYGLDKYTPAFSFFGMNNPSRSVENNFLSQ